MPKKELPAPDVLPVPALAPKKELEPPYVELLPALKPKKELLKPVELLPVLVPKKELLPPSLLCPPAPTPTKRLLYGPALAIKTRFAPILYCVCASKMFAVPVPSMLKFAPVCCVVWF